VSGRASLLWTAGLLGFRRSSVDQKHPLAQAGSQQSPTAIAPHCNESRADRAMVGFVLGRYAGPTTFNEARRGRLGGQSCRRNSAVVGHVLTEAITCRVIGSVAVTVTQSRFALWRTPC
jgi:hypothetical protein